MRNAGFISSTVASFITMLTIVTIAVSITLIMTVCLLLWGSLSCSGVCVCASCLLMLCESHCRLALRDE